MIRPDDPFGPGASAASRRPASPTPLVILGASTRAMAESAARAGWAPYTADLFRDLDLLESARQAVQVATDAEDEMARYPWSLRTAAAGFPPSAPWCYTGALENHPELVDSIAATRPLAGNAAAVLRRLRDPVELAAAAAAAGLDFPETVFSPRGVPDDGTFLLKPLAGAGGRGIRPWTRPLAADPAASAATADRLHVWQRVAAGDAFSAAFCLAPGQARLLGLCRQLIGEPWCHAGRFAWCGAAVSKPPATATRLHDVAARLEPLGHVLANGLGAVGLVGIDLIIDTGGRITVIEANPRPTASMELFERSGAVSIAGCHLAACGFAPPADSPGGQPLPQPAATWAKAVLFAVRPTTISEKTVDALLRDATNWTRADGGWPALADIPRPRQVIPAAAPVVTIFAAGCSEADTLQRLRDRVTHIDAVLLGAIPRP